MGRATVILLIEDNPSDEVLILRALKHSNIVNDVVVSRDGAQAQDYLFGRDKTELPQVVMLDLRLPKVDGLEVLRRLRTDQRTRRLPLVIFTSSIEEEDDLGGRRWEPINFVRKPIDPQQFFEATRRLGLSQQVSKELRASE